MSHAKDPTDVQSEFVSDVKLAYGTCDGDEIDADALDWPDLLTTYEHAVDCTRRCDPEPLPKYEVQAHVPQGSADAVYRLVSGGRVLCTFTDDENAEHHACTVADACNSHSGLVNEIRDLNNRYGQRVSYEDHGTADVALTAQAESEESDHIIVRVDRGLVNGVTSPTGVEVEVRDYDVDDVDEGSMQRDKDGRPYTVEWWGDAPGSSEERGETWLRI